MTEFRTNKNGKVYPLHGGGRGTGAVVAGMVALGLAGGAGALPLGTTGVGTGSGSSLQLQTRKADGQKSAKNGDLAGAWQRLGMRQLKRAARQQAECVAVSFGEIREFFTRNRCTSLERVLFAVGDGDGNSAVVSVVWVGLASTSDAKDFETVMKRHGSGDIHPLGAPLLGLANIEFTGLRYGSDRDGKTVTVAEAETATGSIDHETLDAIAEVAACLPRV